ncbi:hypothetical protein ACFE04_023482 [Oxalis oulophora]
MTTFLKGISLLLIFFYLLAFVSASARNRAYTPPNVERLTDKFSHFSVNQAFNTYYGASNIKSINNGSYTNIVLNKTSGAGLLSKNAYHYGFFSASLKLPAGLSTSGVVVAFYLSNYDSYPHNHDEIDIELLGHDKRNDWVLQTNVYANGSVKTGREEKFYFWFDPTEKFHDYSILWNSHHIVFLVDNVPVREFPSKGGLGAYPSKPMTVYLTIWDGSEWATRGGKYPVDYKYAPFVASMSEAQMSGCKLNNAKDAVGCVKDYPSSLTDPLDGQGFASLSQQQSSAMDWARRKLMFYSYCSDKQRFKVMPPECK